VRLKDGRGWGEGVEVIKNSLGFIKLTLAGAIQVERVS
jgi:hypothetical protein